MLYDFVCLTPYASFRVPCVGLCDTRAQARVTLGTTMQESGFLLRFGVEFEDSGIRPP